MVRYSFYFYHKAIYFLTLVKCSVESDKIFSMNMFLSDKTKAKLNPCEKFTFIVRCKNQTFTNLPHNIDEIVFIVLTPFPGEKQDHFLEKARSIFFL